MKFKTVLSALAMASIATVANAKTSETPLMMELADDVQTISSVSSARMKCLVDTPAYDIYRFGHCFSVGSSRTTKAVFTIDGGPSSNYRVYWSNSSCSQTSKTCMVDIRWYQRITMSADILDLSNGTFTSTSATARYEGYF